MDGIEFVNALPTLAFAAFIIGVAIFFSVGLQLWARASYGVDQLIENHEVAGFKYAVVGVAYAVLLAFVVVGVWEEHDRTDHDVQVEADRFYNLHRNSYNFSNEDGHKMREALLAYARAVRDKDWPMMEKGHRGSQVAADALTRLSYVVGQTRPSESNLLPSLSHAIDLMQDIADMRLERLSDVEGHITPPIWGVLLLGAIITLAYPAFFATRQITPQILMTAGLAAIVGATLFLTIDLNYPFSGPDRLTAEPIDDVIQRMKEESKLHEQ